MSRTDAELVAEYGIIPGSSLMLFPAKPVQPEGHLIADLSEAEFMALIGKRTSPVQVAAFACEGCGGAVWKGTGDLQWYSPQCKSKHPAKGTKFRGHPACGKVALAGAKAEAE